MKRQVVVVPYDPDWPVIFEKERDAILAVAPDAFDSIEHIGSTSVPGLAAKPIIDMLGRLTSFERIENATPAIEAIGYEALGELGLAGRRYFRKRNPDGTHTRHLHTWVSGHESVHRHLAYRDYLRAHPEVAREYGELKAGLADAHPDDIEAYMDGKDAFVKEVERRALEWSRRG